MSVLDVERYPSGQRGRAVNPLAQPSEVRILLSPWKYGLSGNSSVGRASAFQAEGRGFESRFPLFFGNQGAHVAQSVEHFLGKEEVTGSSPVVGFVFLH